MASRPLSAVPESRYTGKQFKLGTEAKYQVGNYQYPADLLGTQTGAGNAQTDPMYGGNYLIMYINVNNDSKMTENPDAGNIFVDVDASERVKKQLAGREYSQEKVVAAQGVIGSGVAAAVTGVTGAGSGLKGAALGAAATVAGAASIAANTKNSIFSRPQKRLKSVIALHVPNQLSIRYGAGWGEEETFGIQAVIEGGEAAMRALQAAGQAALGNGSIEEKGDRAGAALKEGVRDISSIVANFALAKGPNAGAMSAMTGLAPNPMKEQVFKGMDFRTFTMEYQFSPRSIAESDNVNKIIKALKYHMHPEYKDANNFLFLYPSEFDIEYYHQGQENLNLHRHTSCVLTELNVNYTPNGTFSTFKDGRPTQINVSMTFRELTILTKELISEGL
jgi:hypothetical protein